MPFPVYWLTKKNNLLSKEKREKKKASVFVGWFKKQKGNGINEGL